jgi:hypothetical protein
MNLIDGGFDRLPRISYNSRTFRAAHAAFLHNIGA